MKSGTRQRDLDWIKVLVMLVVFLYHCSMFFNPFEWHIKNNVIDTSGIYAFSLAVGIWMMPVFFAISGISSFHALSRRSGGIFIKERFTRLGVPLLFGIFVLAPPQVYVERAASGHFTRGFFSFLPHYFDGVYLEIGGSGNFSIAGHHLWYLLLLLVFSLLLLPFFLRWHSNVEDKPFGLVHYFILPLPLLAAAITLNDVLNLASWGIIFYLLVFVYGYVYFSRTAFRAFVLKSGRWTGFLFGGSLLVFIGWAMVLGFPQADTTAELGFTTLRTFMIWNALFFIFYAGQRWLQSNNRFLTYSNEALMPFYVLHQPVIVLFGFMLYSLELPVWAKLIILVPGSFLTIIGIYHFVVRPVHLLRTMVGIPPKKAGAHEV